MARQCLLLMKEQVASFVEGNGAPSKEEEAAAASDRFDLLGDAIDVNAVGSFAGQAEQNGAISSVSLPGERERAEQFDGHFVDAVKCACAIYLVQKAVRRAHGADRVRARGADADLEEIEDADGHCSSLT